MKATFGLHEEKQGEGEKRSWVFVQGVRYAHVIVERRTPVRHSMGHVAAQPPHVYFVMSTVVSALKGTALPLPILPMPTSPIFP